ncbi:MAG: hypothetical protein ACR2KZ_03540 [Segetibacter sp.]
MRPNIHQKEIVTGIRSYPDEKELTIGMLLGLPLTKIREWKDGHRQTDKNLNQLKK